jgi:hypothetical protein
MSQPSPYDGSASGRVFGRTADRAVRSTDFLKPALISIGAAAGYLGISRSTFYDCFLPQLETVQLGKRRLVVMQSLDELVEKLRGRGGA